jgi:hypothetical protein
MVRGAIVAALTAATLMASGHSGAQGVRLMQECAQHPQPVVREAPSFPAHGPYRYSLVVAFIIDVGGTVVVPRIKTSEFVEPGGRAAAAPDGFETAFLQSFSRWKYARQPRPCSATAELVFSS